MKEKVAVVIPYYHGQLDEVEQISLKQCLKVLYRYPIIFIVPDIMDETEYPTGQNFVFMKVPAQWMQSVSTYNRMMLNRNFYDLFYEYEYILIYQLDAFVFYDDLLKFCDMSYDYIGAPWPLGVYYYKDMKHCIWSVGNGGLSLRNVEASLRMLQNNPADTWNLAEDLYWATCDSTEFHVAPEKIACQFSIERFVRRMYELNQKKIPFGCHAWAKRDYPFWRPYFEKLGYTIPESAAGEEDRKIDGLQENKLKIPKKVVRKRLRDLMDQEVKQIYVWGAGKIGKEWVLFFLRAGYSVKCVDNDRSKWGEYLWDVCIESPDIMKDAGKGSLLVIAVKDHEDIIKKQLFQSKDSQECIVYSYKEMQNVIALPCCD